MLNSIRIAVGADHRGFELKNYLVATDIIGTFTVIWHDVGTCSNERTDYPLFVPPVVKLIQDKLVDAGILVCGTGIGMAIAANRYSSLYAGVAWNAQIARAAKQDDNCMVLVLPADYITHKEAHEIIAAWLGADFKQGRYAERLALIDELPLV
jgi:ribose 5-phosphate isomerase B